ncbi:MAG: alpha/beta hydrolase [Alphaproteobacteria bacterium]|nr:alpha/beta hydrolase [Alphaproteobacteria bacterium]
MPISTANGVEIYYETAGAGPPMVMIHAIPFDHTLWLYQAAHFSTWFQVISVDLRAWGRSAKVTGAYTLDDMGRDIIGVMDDLGADEAVVMGCSVGSKTALKLGASWPERCAAVILVGGGSGAHDMTRRIDGYGSEPFSPYRRAHMDYGVSDAFAETPIAKYLFQCLAERDPWHDPAAVQALFRAFSMEDLRGTLAAYKPPTLIINGEFDSARPRGEETASLMPQARHEILPGTGHACMIEDPAGFDALVVDFLDSHGLMPEI